MRREAVSITSTIAEGTARQTNKDAIQFFVVARGSLSELDIQIELSRSLEMINSADYKLLNEQINSVDSLLSSFTRYRKTRNQ